MIWRRQDSPLIRANFTATSIVFAIICLSLTIMPGKIVSGSAPNSTGITFDFFRILENPTSEKPDNLQSITINQRGRSFVIYTDRKPSFSIPVNEIISITIEREEIRGLKGGYVYKATLSISKDEKNRFDKFASANERQQFDFRFGNKRLGPVQFLGGFGGASGNKNEVATFLESTDSNSLKEIFAPIKNKVIWK